MLAGSPAAVVLADESARYSFASAQGAKDLKVAPGGEVEGLIYFYNIDGNRITHVKLAASSIPDGWQVEIEPAEHTTEVLVNGAAFRVSENLYVEPSGVMSVAPGSIPAGMVSIKIPNRGYVFAVPAVVVAKVPSSAQAGQMVGITVSAEAIWLSQGGGVAMRQERDFQYNVLVTLDADSYTETVVKDNMTLPASVWWGAAAVAAGMLITLVMRFIRKRR
jgi:hypothetical protein